MSHALPLWGKDAFAALDVEPDALPLEETDGRAVVEGGEGRGEKRGVRAHLRGELLRRPGVRHVAAPLSRDADLAARLLHLSSSSTRQPRCAAVPAAIMPAAPAPTTTTS